MARIVQNILIPFHYLKYKFLVSRNVRKARKYALLMYSISSMNKSLAAQSQVDLGALESSVIELKKHRLKLNLAKAISEISEDAKF